MHFRTLAAVAAIAIVTMLPGCAPKTEAPANGVQEEVFGTTPSGEEVHLYTLTNEHGVTLQLMNYGAAVVALRTPDRDGAIEDVVLGFDDLQSYLNGSPYFGAIVGRYGNRIANARFELDGASYQLAANNGVNHLHGGLVGFDKVVWAGEVLNDDEGQGVRFTYVSADGQEGYPGELTVHVTYHLTASDEVTIDYAATTTKATPINITNHAYFNLSGNVRRDILGETLSINADRFTPVGPGLIPTGELRDVAGTPFDFRMATPIGARIDQDDAQLHAGPGYDHNWVLNKPEAGALSVAAVLSDPTSGRVMEVRTTEPAIQFYSGNFLDGSLSGRGATYARRTALCLETQHYPDSPNYPDFPTTILRPGETYTSRTVYAFSVAAAQ
ncbi:MAG: aldose epimerase family protein [Terricaulis sp.]